VLTSSIDLGKIRSCDEDAGAEINGLPLCVCVHELNVRSDVGVGNGLGRE
jgi:hypothetical protein